jgi:signal peptidase I
MNQIAKTLLALVVAALVVVGVRAYFFSVYTVTTNLTPQLVKGDRVMVNKVSRAQFHRGDLMVFDSHGKHIGLVEAVPGDTIELNDGSRFLIPQICCDRCLCPDCKLYLVYTGNSKMLVHRHQVVGSAKRLFHLPW